MNWKESEKLSKMLIYNNKNIVYSIEELKSTRKTIEKVLTDSIKCLEKQNKNNRNLIIKLGSMQDIILNYLLGLILQKQTYLENENRRFNNV